MDHRQEMHRGLPKKAAKTLEGNGFQVTLSSMSDFKPNNLKKVQNLLIIVSTHGEGDPPDNALSFHEFLHGKRAPKLTILTFLSCHLETAHMSFSVRQEKNLIQAFRRTWRQTDLSSLLTVI